MPLLLASSKRATVSEGLPKASQVVPLSSEYCQTPFVLSTPVTAMPTGAVVGGETGVWYPGLVVLSGSVIYAVGGPMAVTKLLTEVPGIMAAVWSSLTEG